MAKRRQNYGKSSNYPDPIGAFLDIAGAAALGIYVKHKVQKDYRRGRGRESSIAAAAVFGSGSMRRGSQGTINLGGLLGLNSALKNIERQQMSSVATDYLPFHSPIDKVPAISHPAKSGMWRDYCEDGTAYGIIPEDYDNADDYEDALRKAKAGTASSQEKNQEILSETTESREKNKYCWREYCEDGTQYGIYPEDFESADDYEDALNDARIKQT